MNTTADVKGWLKAMGQKGVYGGAAARLRATALEQLSSVLGSDEPDDAKWLLEHIDVIARRWATKNRANPGTAGTYLSRARTSLREFLAFQEDPTKFPSARHATSRSNGRRVRSSVAAQSGMPIEDGIPDAGRNTVEYQSFAFSLTEGKSAYLRVPVRMSPADIRIIGKQIEFLEVQSQSMESEN
jgi:hypothetical protein